MHPDTADYVDVVWDDEFTPPRDTTWTEPVFVPVQPVTPCDPDRMSVEQCLAAMAANEQAQAFLHSENVRLLERMHRDPEPAGLRFIDYGKAQDYQVDEIAAYLRWSPWTAARRVNTACIIVEHLPGTHDGLTNGSLTFDRATAIADAAASFRSADTARLAVELEARLLERAGRQTPPELKRAARRAAAALDPRGHDERHREAADDRHVRVIARDRTSRGLGRSTPARRSELDHLIRWADDGHTNELNLHALDRRSHHLKDDADSGWQLLRRNPDGGTEWALPHGHLRTKPPDELPEDRTSTIRDDPPPF